jgi:nucleotide-binding universal stress UspA family protein
MTMKILLPIDGSYHSDNAIQTVLSEPWPEGSECNIITVADTMHAGVDAYFGQLGSMALAAQQALDADIKKLLEEAKEKLEGKFGKGNVLANYSESKPSGVGGIIVETAKNWRADLIVMGSHGTSGWDDRFFGSVTIFVSNHAPCSVRIVHFIPSSSVEKKQKQKLPGDELLEETRYLVAINESSNSQAVLDSIMSRPWPPDSLFQIISVVPEPKSVFHSRWFQDIKVDEKHKELYASQKQLAEKLTKESASRIESKIGKGKVTYHVLEGNVRSLILQIAQDWPADMIILGAHDRDKSLLEHFLGSVAQAVLNNADCSIEIVRGRA